MKERRGSGERKRGEEEEGKRVRDREGRMGEKELKTRYNTSTYIENRHETRVKNI